MKMMMMTRNETRNEKRKTKQNDKKTKRNEKRNETKNETKTKRRQIAGCETKREEQKAGSQKRKRKCEEKGEIHDYKNREDVERYIFIIIHEHE